MHLIIDVGNTYCKYYLFQNTKQIEKGKVEDFYALKKNPALLSAQVEKVIFSDVSGTINLEDLQQLFPEKACYDAAQLNLPFDNQYQTPKTMGSDRIALVAAAVKRYPKKNVLIIDAGSCLTFDLLTEENTYLGGGISPGLAMRFKSLHQFTGKLPLVALSTDPLLWGNSTIASIATGVYRGLVHEIDGQISDYNHQFPNLTVILTGGDAQRLSKSLKSTIFVAPNFLAEGLDYLLHFNTDKT